MYSHICLPRNKCKISGCYKLWLGTNLNTRITSI